MVQGHDRGEPESEGGIDHPAVVGELGAGETARERLDPGPFDAETVRGQARIGEQLHVLGVPVVTVDGVAAGSMPGTVCSWSHQSLLMLLPSIW